MRWGAAVPPTCPSRKAQRKPRLAPSSTRSLGTPRSQRPSAACQKAQGAWLVSRRALPLLHRPEPAALGCVRQPLPSVRQTPAAPCLFLPAPAARNRPALCWRESAPPPDPPGLLPQVDHSAEDDHGLELQPRGAPRRSLVRVAQPRVTPSFLFRLRSRGPLTSARAT